MERSLKTLNTCSPKVTSEASISFEKFTNCFLVKSIIVVLHVLHQPFPLHQSSSNPTYWEKRSIYSTKLFSAGRGMPFARPNELPPTAERHLLDQTGFRQQRNAICSAKQASASSGKAFARPNAICATATTPSFRSKGYSPLPPLPLAAPCLRTPAVKIAFFKQKTFGCGIFLKD